jgi:hypothetical protein
MALVHLQQGRWPFTHDSKAKSHGLEIRGFIIDQTVVDCARSRTLATIGFSSPASCLQPSNGG